MISLDLAHMVYPFSQLIRFSKILIQIGLREYIPKVKIAGTVGKMLSGQFFTNNTATICKSP